MKYIKQIPLIVCALVVGFVSSNFMVRSVSADTELPFICTGCVNIPLWLFEGELQGAILNGATLVGSGETDFSNAQLISTLFDGTSFTDSDFSGASMQRAYIVTNVNFENSDFTGANMRSFYFFGGSTINLDGADLTDADLTGTNLDTYGSVTGATWSNTTCPDGTNSDNNSNTCGGPLTP
jgi:uncharacterized protein YjbI with pentapeptide repeats